MKNHFGLEKKAMIGIIAAIIVTILFAVGGYFLYKRFKNKTPETKSKLS